MDDVSLSGPLCRMGYPITQLENELTSVGYLALTKWLYGQTLAICEGREYNHDTEKYEQSCGGVPHGVVAYTWDVWRWIDGRPVID